MMDRSSATSCARESSKLFAVFNDDSIGMIISQLLSAKTIMTLDSDDRVVGSDLSVINHVPSGSGELFLATNDVSIMLIRALKSIFCYT